MEYVTLKALEWLSISIFIVWYTSYLICKCWCFNTDTYKDMTDLSRLWMECHAWCPWEDESLTIPKIISPTPALRSNSGNNSCKLCTMYGVYKHEFGGTTKVLLMIWWCLSSSLTCRLDFQIILKLSALHLWSILPKSCNLSNLTKSRNPSSLFAIS
jgi:hypothetical protein